MTKWQHPRASSANLPESQKSFSSPRRRRRDPRRDRFLRLLVPLGRRRHGFRRHLDPVEESLAQAAGAALEGKTAQSLAGEEERIDENRGKGGAMTKDVVTADETSLSRRKRPS